MSTFPRPGDRYGKYQIVREIGRGGMGVVYEATDVSLGRQVALKIILPGLADVEEYGRRFAREASVLARVRSRHIVEPLEYGEQDGTVYLVTQFLPDGDLHRWLSTHGAFGPAEALVLIDQIAEGLADAHAAGVIHRDLKPSNILLWDRAGTVIPYLCDFGIAADETNPGATRTGMVAGSFTYMAPERHLGSPADERTDLYSLGCLLWAIVTGNPPWSGTDFQVMNAHINQPIPQLPGTDPMTAAVNTVLVRTMAKDPAHRPAGVSALRREIAELRPTAAAPAAPPPPFVPAQDATLVRPRTDEKPLLPPPPPPPPPWTPTPTPTPTPGPQLIEPAPKRGFMIALICVIVLGLIGGAVATGIVLSNRDSDDTSSTPGKDEEKEKVVLQTPPPPTGTGAPGYRSVIFTVSPVAMASQASGVVEYYRNGVWKRMTGSTQKLPTGPETELCVPFRTYVSGDAVGADDVTSTSTTICGDPKPRTAFVTYKTGSRSYCEDLYPCWKVIVHVANFAPYAEVKFDMYFPNGSVFCPVCKDRTIYTGEFGNGSTIPAIQRKGTTDSMYVVARGVSSEVVDFP